MKHDKQIAIFGGGCFWCTEATFQQLKGVSKVTSGYAGGELENPGYGKVATGHTGHAEVIKVEFDPNEISFENLLEVFFAVHDPTTLNKQGNDIGTEYRSIILYTSEEQKAAAEKSIQKLRDSGEYNMPIVTEIKPFDKFYEAEDYHHNYYNKNPDQPYCQIVINPKLKKLKEKYSKLLK